MSSQVSQVSQVWVCGEALIDLVPVEDGFSRAIVGGGPANTAKALANLGIKTFFIGGISTDAYGEQIENELLDYGVDLSHSHRSKLATAIAKLRIDDNGAAMYEFSLTDTATFDFHSDWLPKGEVELLYLGSLAAITAPGSTALLHWARGLNTQIIFDPNVRPNVLADSSRYLAMIKPWLDIATIVKLSTDDLRFLFGNNGERESISQILQHGAKLLILTRGEHGLSAYAKNLERHQHAQEVAVVDTVGAGDTVGAIIAEGLSRFGLEALLAGELEKVLNRASRAAAITCSRAGAKPPSAAEL